MSSFSVGSKEGTYSILAESLKPSRLLAKSSAHPSFFSVIMGRWTQYDEDSYRLPDGVRRTGYDAESGRYRFQDDVGTTYQGAPHARYGGITASQRGQSGSLKDQPKKTHKPARSVSIDYHVLSTQKGRPVSHVEKETQTLRSSSMSCTTSQDKACEPSPENISHPVPHPALSGLSQTASRHKALPAPPTVSIPRCEDQGEPSRFAGLFRKVTSINVPSAIRGLRRAVRASVAEKSS